MQVKMRDEKKDGGVRKGSRSRALGRKGGKIKNIILRRIGVKKGD